MFRRRSNARATSRKTPESPEPRIPAPRHARHIGALFWWSMVLVAIFGVQYWSSHVPSGLTATSQASRTEREAFIAFVFGKVSAEDPAAIHPSVLRRQLAQLKDSGSHPVRLEDVRLFLERGEPLPPKPFLLVFDEARRETVDAVEPVLTDLQLPAVSFVSVAEVEGGNVDLVSRRRIGKMAASGRWEVGVNACQRPANVERSETSAAQEKTDFRSDSVTLQRWAARPVLAASCLWGWSDTANMRSRWLKALDQAAIPLGFVTRAPGVNHQDDRAVMLRLIRIPREDGQTDALVRHTVAHTPREKPFVDDFEDGELDHAWVTSGDHAYTRNGKLHLTAGAGDTDGWMSLGGTARWRDVQVEVELDEPSSGQFWIYARRNTSASFVRLGTVDRRVILQKSDADGQTRQMASREVDGGPLRLSLRVLGSRAVAYLDGEPLLDRPAQLPGHVTEGPVSLAVWNAEGAASASLRRVAVNPLSRRYLVVAAQPAQGDFARMRREAVDVWAISPRLFRWHNGSGSASDPPALALEIFVRHHRLALLPAVTLDELPPESKWHGFSQRMLEWAGRPGFAGLNMVVDSIGPRDIGRIEDLRRTLGARGKELVVTARRLQPGFPERRNLVWLADPEPGPAGFELGRSSLRRHPPG